MRTNSQHPWIEMLLIVFELHKVNFSTWIK